MTTGLLIKNGALIDDPWQTLCLSESDDPAAIPLPPGRWLFPLALWQARQEEIAARPEAPGLLLQGHDPVEAVLADGPRFAIIAVHFAKFTDGRGYSTAALLRRAGFGGELRAVGDILIDQLFYLRRVGFDAFALRPDQNPHHAQALGFATFSETYQGAADQALPLFRRRIA